MMERPAIIAFAIALCAATPVVADRIEGQKSSAEIVEAARAADWRALDPEDTLYIQTEHGRIVVALSQTLAAAHVQQIKALAREGFYDGLSFYRVIDGFVAQGGDNFETRKIKTAKETLQAEFEEPVDAGFPFDALNDIDGYAAQSGFSRSLPTAHDPETETAWHLHCAGAIAMARQEGRNTSGTEFYIALQPQRYLDRNLTVFGRVVDGMEIVQRLRRVAPAETPAGDLGDIIVSMSVASDLPEEERTDLQILRTDTPTFTAYGEARRNRPEAFFYYRPNHIDVCALPIPVKAAAVATPAGEAGEDGAQGAEETDEGDQ